MNADVARLVALSLPPLPAEVEVVTDDMKKSRILSVGIAALVA